MPSPVMGLLAHRPSRGASPTRAPSRPRTLPRQRASALPPGAASIIAGRSLVLRGVVIAGAVGTLVNSGTITNSSTHADVALIDGGRVTNTSGGRLQNSGGTALHAENAAISVTNAGRIISGTSHAAIALKTGGYVDNVSTGTINGAEADGLYLIGGAGRVLNAGVIGATGTGGNAIY